MKPIDIIFDTDVGSDCDDMMALAYLIYAQRKGYCNVKAVTHCQCTPYGIPAIRAFFRFFGENIPLIGRMQGGVILKDRYAEKVAKAFACEDDYNEAPDAVSVIRKALAECKDKCIICAVGQFTNIAQLLESKGDEISPLDGIALVKEKCEKMVLMAGKFREDEHGVYGADWNIRCDVPSAKIMFELSPVPFVILPSETGKFMISGKSACDKYGDTNPLTKSFFEFLDARNGRHSWDPATAVYCCEGVKEFLNESEKGTVTMTNEGVTYFKPDENGNCTVLTNKTEGITEEESKSRMARYIDACAEEVLNNV